MKKSLTSILIVAVLAIVVVVFFGSAIFKTVESTERGVIFRRLTTGLDKDKIFMPGLQIIAPWNDLIIYDLAEQITEQQLNVLDKNGLSISMDVSVRFQPNPERIGYLHEAFRGQYLNSLVIPEIRSSVRRVTGRFSAEEIYSTKRTEVEESIKEETGKVLQENNIVMKALLIRSIDLPEQIKNAIENKLKQEQEALAYKFRLDRERSEAERRRIEAEGIANYNQIISSSLTDRILQQRGIEATLELSKSQNTKVVVVGSGDNGLPLILGNN
ncbi:MAG: prohibitin family protein [Bacteroidota bacterium]